MGVEDGRELLFFLNTPPPLPNSGEAGDGHCTLSCCMEFGVTVYVPFIRMNISRLLSVFR